MPSNGRFASSAPSAGSRAEWAEEGALGFAWEQQRWGRVCGALL